MAKEDKIRQVIEEYGDTLTKTFPFYSGRDIPYNKLNNAISTYASSAKIDDVYGLIDTTLFGSAKEGSLMTKEGMYIKECLTKPVYFKWQDIEKVEVLGNNADDTKNTLKIYWSGKSYSLACSFYRKKMLCNMINEIININNSLSGSEVVGGILGCIGTVFNSLSDIVDAAEKSSKALQEQIDTTIQEIEANSADEYIIQDDFVAQDDFIAQDDYYQLNNDANEYMPQMQEPVEQPVNHTGVNKADIINQIRELASLRDENILTEEEFNAEKKKLLSRL